MPGFERWFTRAGRLLGSAASSKAAQSASASAPKSVTVNGKKYAVPAPGTHIVLISAEGLSQDHIDAAVARKAMPTWSRLMSQPAGPAPLSSRTNDNTDEGMEAAAPSVPDFFRMRATHGLVSGAYPSLSEPNWACLVSGMPPVKTGITGAHALAVPPQLLQPSTALPAAAAAAATAAAQAEPVPVPPVSTWPVLDLTIPGAFKCDSILPALAAEGVEVTVLTTTDAAARLLSHQLLPALAAHSGEIKPSVQAAAAGGGSVVSLETLAAAEDDAGAVAVDDSGAPQSKGQGKRQGVGKCFADPLTAVITRGIKAALHPHSSAATSAVPSAAQTPAPPAQVPASAMETLLLLPRRLRLHPSAPALTVVSLGDFITPHTNASATSTTPSGPAPVSSDAATSSLAALDSALAALDAAGCIVAVLAPHATVVREGFTKKPRVVCVVDELVKAGAARDSFRVTLPAASADDCAAARSTDAKGGLVPGLSSCAMIYTHAPSVLHPAIEKLRAVPGVYAVVGRKDAAHAFDLPPEMIGDYLAIGDTRTVLGTTVGETGDVPEGFRANGAVDDATVPLWINRPLPRSMRDKLNRGQLRTYDALDLLLNGAVTAV